jgi:hypothetical protein
VQPSRYLSLSAVARSRPGRAGRPHVNPATVQRWITRGIRSRDGGRIRLRAKRCGWSWATTPEWLAEFEEALTADRIGDASPTPRSPSALQRDSERAARTLIADGC